MFQSRMLISLRKSSLIPDFLFSLLQLFTRVTVRSAPYLLLLNALLVSVCSKDLLICFADHLRGECDWCVGRHFNEFYNCFLLIFFLSIFFFYLRRFTYTHQPHPLPRPKTFIVTLTLNCQ